MPWVMTINNSPFIDTQDLSNRLGRDVTADAGATAAVASACDICRDIAEQDFSPSTTTASFDGTGTDAIVLPQQPVLSAGTVLVNGGTVTDYMLTGQGLLLRGSAGSNCSGWRPVWPMGRQNVKVTYDHGFTTVPRSVWEVAVSLASRLIVQGVVQSETVGDVQIGYGMSADDLTVNELRILRGYARARSF